LRQTESIGVLRKAIARTSRWTALVPVVLAAGACVKPCVLPPAQLASLHAVESGECRDAVECLRGYRGTLAWMSAHRGGGRQLGPQNTIAGIGESVRRRVPLIEIDVRRGADGKLFLFHDRRLRPDNNTGPSEFNLKTIEKLSGEQRAVITVGDAREEHVPLFAEALRVLAGSATAAQLDIKDDSRTVMPQISAEIKAAHAERNVVVQCRDQEMLTAVRTNYPSLPVLFRATKAEQIAPALRFKPELVQIDDDWMTADVIRQIHAGGSRILVKTLSPHGDYARNWRELFQSGVDVLLTDYPVRMRETLAACTPAE
jgi:glycerophosphoryl diester phosphodiesterase